MLGKLFSVRDGLKLPALWRWLLTLAGCLLTGLGLALACRLIDSQSLRQMLAALTQGSLWFTALFLALACAVFALLTHSLFIGSAVTALLSVLLTFVNYFKVLITSVPLSLGDFTLIGQVGNIATLNASAITFGRNSILAVMGVVLWLAVVCFFSKPLRLRWRWSLAGAAGAALAFALVFWVGADRLDRPGLVPDRGERGLRRTHPRPVAQPVSAKQPEPGGELLPTVHGGHRHPGRGIFRCPAHLIRRQTAEYHPDLV